MAATALSGCVTVQRPPVSVAPAVSSPPPAPRPDRTAGRQTVQPPAREALEFVGSSPSPSSPEPDGHTRPPVVPSPAKKRRNPPVVRSPGRRAPSHPAGPRHTPVPPRLQDPLPQPADLCALGRQYGGWKPDSPEARICKQTYGR
ncbi:hypothetical protein GCM10009549_53970 [Streptomyces thermoalcalitolerans]|uniref:Lipoprotein n=2 Tax=Streptomyces thermoalcalitolerans TaxID=65605 RepID=A0ABN1PPB6_9ACTN